MWRSSREYIRSDFIYCLYNDLELFVQSNIIFYADDTVLYNTDFVKLQQDLARVADWCNANRLTINCKKSQWLKTSIMEKRGEDRVLELAGKQLERVVVYKYLGINVDSSLNFQHIETIL